MCGGNKQTIKSPDDNYDDFLATFLHLLSTGFALATTHMNTSNWPLPSKVTGTRLTGAHQEVKHPLLSGVNMSYI